MAGLNYGNRFKRRTDWAFSEGVFYADSIDKWIVRVLRKGKYTTLSQHKTEEEAEKAFNSLN